MSWKSILKREALFVAIVLLLFAAVEYGRSAQDAWGNSPLPDPAQAVGEKG